MREKMFPTELETFLNDHTKNKLMTTQLFDQIYTYIHAIQSVNDELVKYEIDLILCSVSTFLPLFASNHFSGRD